MGYPERKKALEEYAIKLNLNKTKLESVGLIINPKWPWLGASPDALVDSDIVQLDQEFLQVGITSKGKKFHYAHWLGISLKVPKS